jgi:vacuolar protein sorting-associated protein 13A/C
LLSISYKVPYEKLLLCIQLCIDGYKWSAPFSVNYEGVMRISLKKEVGDERMQLRVAVRSGAKRSRFEVVFRLNSLSSPYRFFSSHYLPYESS